MSKCVRDYTVIFSQPSIEALENLMSCFFTTFGIEKNIDELFYYGVFCKPANYANFKFDEESAERLDLPDFLTDDCINIMDKVKCVKAVIHQVLRREIEKPEWMKVVELEDISDDYGQPPSTFLTILPTEEQYEELAVKLIDFLYSPNRLTTMLCDNN